MGARIALTPVIIQRIVKIRVAAAAVADGGADVGEIGHFELGFTNEYNGIAYRFMRIFTEVAGTVATGIDFVAHLAKKA